MLSLHRRILICYFTAANCLPTLPAARCQQMKNPADYPGGECLRFGRYVVHHLEQAISVDGKLHPVEPRVFALLWYLILRRPHIVRTDELIERVWSGQATKPARIAQCVAKARKAVGDDARAPTLIRTVYGVGYQFVGNPSQPEAVARKVAGV